MRVLGMISGTSHDGIDLAVVDLDADGDVLVGSVLTSDTVPYDPDLRARLVAALPPAATTLSEMCQLDTLIGQAFAQAAAEAAERVGGVDAVCSHGQTVYHWVEADHALGTLQLGQPAWIAERVGRPVVADVRARDLTIGGHGAPLASLLDALLLGGHAGVPAALNLGGISNMTVITDGRVSAFDIGPSNALMDAVVQTEGLDPRGYDDGGRLAAGGSVDVDLLDALLADPYYALPAPKSTGKEHFHGTYVREAVAALGHDISPIDLLATLTELTVRTVAEAVRTAGVTYLAMSGGGCRNPLLVDGIRAALPDVEVVTTDALSVPTDAKEAILLAVIGWCTLHGLPGVVAGGTGARVPRILGSITPGSGPLRLPEPASPIRSIRLHGGVT
ncbi:MAG: anhydro-N-acetylmuramic acid kinase [Actinomycetales bacterium]|jgi:anhydro-N-acetylmuramic acid kinase|uniref:Anhydro-N-acetylmuramic acid kinase n=1 Tax=Candidatus Phosphoribacter hodrii TaxID=2953743 RepID=A0A935M509_9MICO|nr:anhydro-N-acetylmuramic acid kinase [Candidatus Phosphoribacter hodrii]HOA02750.1 anhydro-N-acetylmuramic acid kinase [Dermatophilaceae bacterium]MBK7274750.1 anhydro-N-acetylmuramic acid kinase [Candidatus Phosphoribacter hodrii]HOU99752.1 anhydro-N-acetylmuramic acid kinase [Dermatophilaceae bacterium]HPV79363.1 anhydro-N-acetylmuramic acid kinase [Dermatophilaceae bacterium]